MAGVAKWLRQWVVVPPFVGSSPITRPNKNIKKNFFINRLIKLNIGLEKFLCHVIEDQNYVLLED